MEIENIYNAEWSKLNSLLSHHFIFLLYLALLHSVAQDQACPILIPTIAVGKSLHVRPDSLHSTSTLQSSRLHKSIISTHQ